MPMSQSLIWPSQPTLTKLLSGYAAIPSIGFWWPTREKSVLLAKISQILIVCILTGGYHKSEFRKFAKR